MITELGIGTRTQSVEIPDQNLQEILLPNQVEIGLRGEAEVRRAGPRTALFALVPEHISGKRVNES